MLTTDIKGQTVIHVCRPTRHHKQVPALKRPTPPAPAAATALTRRFRCASEGCKATCELTEDDPLPAGWRAFVKPRAAGAPTLYGYHCPEHATKGSPR